MTDKEDLESPEIELKTTADGSVTLFVPHLNEHYHSTYGALTESRHIYIGAGLKSLPENLLSVDILEIGFGTGLNAFLTFIETAEGHTRVKYQSIERWPLAEEVYSQLNYPQVAGFVHGMEIFQKMHRSPWNAWFELRHNFFLQKIHSSLLEYHPPESAFDLVYFDAFGPEVQPEMWTREVFVKIFSGMRRGGILVTYSTKGEVKRALKDSGFRIEKLPGPPGKREILRANKPTW